VTVPAKLREMLRANQRGLRRAHEGDRELGRGRHHVGGTVGVMAVC
jgi:hypothetical protein